MSDISLIHPDDANWFITLDETHHAFSTKGNKGGSTEVRFTNPCFPRSGDRVIENSHHTTGVYGYTLAGEVLPPLYILSTGSKNEANYKFDPAVCRGLPMVTAKYAGDKVKAWPSCIAIRPKGSMDTPLWHDLNKNVFLKCYKGKVSPVPIRDPITKKLIRGPLISKTDAGPGRLATQGGSLDFRSEMAAIGVFILLSLPNGTECTAELDQMYSEFKGECKKSTVRVAGLKMAARVQARKKGMVQREHQQEEQNQSHTAALEEYLEGKADSDEDVDSDDYEFSVGRSACSVNLGNRDLGHIINGFPGDPLNLRPFDKCFCTVKIINTWIVVGFLPMTGNAALDPKVRYELGEGGAPEEARKRMELLVKDYEKSASEMDRLGFNGGVMDLEARHVDDLQIPEDEEELIQHIVDNKLINRAGGLFKCGIQIANSRVVLEASKRVEENEKAEKARKAEKVQEKEEGATWAAILTFGKWLTKGSPVDANGYPKLGKADSKAIVKVLLARIAPNEKMSSYDSMKKCVTWLGDLAGGTTWVEEMKQVEKGHWLEETQTVQKLF